MSTPESGSGDVPAGATAENAFYDIARWRLDEQLRRVDALDTKVANMFYLIAALAPLFGALFVFSDTEGAAKGLYVLAVAVYFMVVALTVVAYMGSRWSVRPALSTLRDYSDAYDEWTVRRWIARETMISIAINERRLQRKGYFASAATMAFAVDAVIIALGAVAAAFG